ncbi:MAG: DEAD/DEAH box helicase, partial [Parvularculaceae bacterium]|nr:DEAD/DEAH box helicase [Parvularculaceae bacterium]
MRPTILNPLFADVIALPGIGPRLAVLVAKAAGPRVVDVLFHRPHGVIDRSRRPKIADAVIGEIATIEVTVDRHDPPPVKRRPYRIICSDETGFITLIFFHARADYLIKTLPEGSRRIISGKIEEFSGGKQISHPDHIADPEKPDELPLYEPVYPLTSGLPPSVMRKAGMAAVKRAPQLAEWQEPNWIARNKFPTWNDAIKSVHSPKSTLDLKPDAPHMARLGYDELLSNQLALALIRNARKKAAGRAFVGDGKTRAKAVAALPFTLTQAQSTALAEIDADMAAPDRMVRLIQGDVGSGKTIVAFLAMITAIDSGAQAALLAPTEILARQHYETLGPLAERVGLTVELLTGRDKGPARAAKLSALKKGYIHILIGTHALFQDDVEFSDLGLAVIDEQHRFGVQQRAALAAKGHRTDLLVMTATP